MREEPVPLDRYAPDEAPEVRQVLELLEIAWERGRNTLAPAPVSAAQLRVMYIIERDPGINLRTLGRHLDAAAPSVSRLCDRLQAAGFVGRTPRPDDRREMLLELTEAGAAHLRDVRRRREQALYQAMQRMTPAAREALTTGLSAFCEAAEEPFLPAESPRRQETV
ncbi:MULTISPECIES: MarR family winged helix-turn-helix transcriptional regulator [Streptomyces]|uniref:MarR family winged helix-turn-helix transcriptional regulator n=2 Tax=Streptomyces TaxID=1883 RepID=A0ABW0BBX8_9ACTN|nr:MULTISPECIES: MarR family transcriptional regulator [Streptomyces]KPC84199.1 MarR family transcriptional regulator [Streptomyces sp. NRRL S-4]